MSCTGPCEQGRKPCPCPAACEQESDDSPSTIEAVGRLVVWAFALIGFVAVLAGLFKVYGN